jgi:hypothetical protein
MHQSPRLPLHKKIDKYEVGGSKVFKAWMEFDERL